MERITDLQLISLCNMAYKIASKVLANRLKLILQSIITKNQSAFVQGRLISDNVVVENEILHFMKNKHNGLSGFMGLKINIFKAYDKLEWRFLEGLMRTMGLCDQ